MSYEWSLALAHQAAVPKFALLFLYLEKKKKKKKTL